MKKILFVAAHRLNRSPSQRFRFEQYFDYLNKHGYHCDFSYLISEKDDKVFYNPGNYSKKFYVFLKSMFIRLRDVLKASSYDIIFIQREAFMTGTVFFENRFARSGAKVVFDFDDAIWHDNVSDANKGFSWLKKPEKIVEIISHSHLIIAGNHFLAAFAKQFNDNVKIIPTTINTDEYKRAEKSSASETVCIGWSGSLTTIKHFELAIPFLTELKKKYGDGITIKVIGDGTYVNKELGIKGIPWNSKDEIKELSTFDIGIMPLPDDEWSKGKCGLKGLQYMALEIPAIMSPVGVNTEIIQDGVNGFLANTNEEWINRISTLIDNAPLRCTMGKAARQTIIEKYSVLSQQSYYLQVFDALIAK
jgi:glycosyltransferase involved in cell wall biosynthesis